MRIGKKMREILKVLDRCGFEKSLMETEIILKIKGLKPYRFPPDEWHKKPSKRYNQEELASALRGESVSYPYTGNDDGDKLYALYSRSIKLLYENKLIFYLGNNKTNRRRYKITERGRQTLLEYYMALSNEFPIGQKQGQKQAKKTNKPFIINKTTNFNNHKYRQKRENKPFKTNKISIS